MSTKVVAAQMPQFAAMSPFVRHLQSGVRWLFQRISPAAADAKRALVVEERVTIGPKKAMVLVRCHAQRFLVATAGDTVGPFIEIDAPKAGRRPRREREA